MQTMIAKGPSAGSSSNRFYLPELPSIPPLPSTDSHAPGVAEAVAALCGPAPIEALPDAPTLRHDFSSAQTLRPTGDEEGL